MADTRKPQFEDVCLSRTLKRLRLAQGLTQGDVAERAHTTYQQIQKFENGSNRVVFSMFVRMSEALGCTPTELMQSVQTEIANAAAGADRCAERTAEWMPGR